MQATRHLRHRLEYIGFRLLGLIFGAMSLEAASAFGGWLVSALGPLSQWRHPRLLRNLGRAYPNMPQAEREKLARAVWTNLGFVLGEFFHLEQVAKERLTCANADVLRNIVARGKGAVICGAHQINWEAASGILDMHGLNPIVVYHPLSNPLIDADVKHRRQCLYPAGLLAKRDRLTPLVMARHVRSGSGVAALLIDQNTSSGLKMSFFGHLAPSTPFPALVARKFNTPLILITGIREPGIRFKLTCHEIETPQTQDMDVDIFAATASLQTTLEKSIRQHPEQWMWTHSRWP